MSDIYTYRIDVFAAQPVDLSGFDVEATDGHIGKVDEASFEAGSSCLVVDTGFWIFGHKRMIPAGVVRDVDLDSRKLFLSLSKQDVKDAPDYDAERYAADAGAHHAEQAGYYGQFGA